MAAIPVVESAKHTIILKNQNDKLMLPNNVKVTYTCNEGYELATAGSNIATCEYDIKPREGAPDGDDAKIVTAVWRGQDNIQCVKGMCCGYKSTKVMKIGFNLCQGVLGSK